MLVDVRRVTAHDHTTHSRIRNGKLRQLTKSLYVEASEWKKLEPYEQEFLRCCAASRQSTKAVLVGFSAARVCGVWVHYDTKPGVQVALPSGKPPSAKAQSPGIDYKRMAVPDEDVFDRAGVRFTNAIRTAIDIARSSGERSGIIAFESLLTRCSDHQADLIREECAAMMQRMRGTKGIGKARHTLAKATNRSESTYETLLRLILEEHGITCHAQVLIGPYRVDLLIGDLIIEVDGWGKMKEGAGGSVCETDRPRELVEGAGLQDPARDPQRDQPQRGSCGAPRPGRARRGFAHPTGGSAPSPAEGAEPAGVLSRGVG